MACVVGRVQESDKLVVMLLDDDGGSISLVVLCGCGCARRKESVRPLQRGLVLKDGGFVSVLVRAAVVWVRQCRGARTRKEARQNESASDA